MRSLATLRGALASALFALFGAASGCTAFLDGAPTFGDRCEFEGDSSECGQCLRDECQDEIDACCGGACGRALEHLDACALGGDAEACARLKAVGGGEEDDDRATDLGRCVERECDRSCSSAASVTRCSESAGGCTCEVDRDDANDASCEVEIGGCCAGADWPASGRCVCAELSCTYDSDLYSCECTRGASLGGTGREDVASCDDMGFLYCCVTTSGCECQDDFPCDEYAAATCWVGATVCAADELEVEQCHATEDDLGG